jgi:hypothetical protein
MPAVVKARDLVPGQQFRYNLNLSPERLTVVSAAREGDVVHVTVRRQSGFAVTLPFYPDQELDLASDISVWACTYIDCGDFDHAQTFLVMLEGSRTPSRSEVCDRLGLGKGLVCLSRVVNVTPQAAEAFSTTPSIGLPSLPQSS